MFSLEPGRESDRQDAYPTLTGLANLLSLEAVWEGEAPAVPNSPSKQPPIITSHRSGSLDVEQPNVC